MSFRRKSNRHDIWVDLVSRCPEISQFLPSTIMHSERMFRQFVTVGEVESEVQSSLPRLSDLSDEQIERLWKFINFEAQFDMDALLFDAFNSEFRSRVAGRSAG